MKEQVASEAQEVSRRLKAAGHEAFVVGGCVRDILLGRDAKDWDVATSARPEVVQGLFRRCIPTGIAHGTVTVLVGKTPIEVTTFRGEAEYSDARRPDRVNFGVTLEEDLARRDFTVNALAYDPIDDRLVDPFGGREDLAARRLRAVGDPAIRFREDGLRVMRAVRFVATLEMSLDRSTEAAIPGALDSLRKVSAERVRDELVKLLSAPRPSLGLRVAQRTGILAVILPELAEGVGVVQNRFHASDVWEHTMATVDNTPGDAIRRLGALLHDVGKPRTAAPKVDSPSEQTFFRHEAVGAEMTDAIMRRLKFSNRERERVTAMVAHHMFWYSPEWTDATVRRFVRRVGVDLIPDLFALREGDVRGRGRGEDPEVELCELRARVHAVLDEDQALSIQDLALDGEDIMAALGIPPGRRVGEILRALLERVLEDPSLNERDRLLSLAAEIHAERGQQSGT
ncbi:MAG: CCA tRNA nucleotidyltransferase [Deltaproteobacteria bacterium]|nr:CCA tRNA nucleotidyltransferase [Deltaproteobacteria bacterium]